MPTNLLMSRLAEIELVGVVICRYVSEVKVPESKEKWIAFCRRSRENNFSPRLQL